MTSLQALEKRNLAEARRKVLFITLEPISKTMAGPAIRCVELASQLANEFNITVYSPRPTDLSETEFLNSSLALVTHLNKARLYKLAEQHDILFVQANVLKTYPRLASLGKYLVVDLYDPYLFSILAQYANDPATASSSYRLMHQVLEKHMIRADFSICASERQRDYWIGRYCALGRLTPELYRFDPSLRKLIDVVPYGLPRTSARRNGPGIKGQIPGIAEGDQLLLWGGGIWEWFDPLTIIQAVSAVSKTNNRVRLFFMGWKSPNPQVPLMDMAVKARALAEELGLIDRHVFFNESWIPYADRINYLADADIAVSAHFDLPETRFSFRTRILDYFWAGLPILTTGGDQLAEMIDHTGAGKALPYKDVNAWIEAINMLLGSPDQAQQMGHQSALLAQQFVWDKTAESLRLYCRNPHKLPPFTRLRMPSIVERARAVYSRGGTDLVLKRSRNLIEDLIRK